MWSLGLMLVVPFMLGCLAFAPVFLAGNSTPRSVTAGIVSMALTAAALSCVLFLPADYRLPDLLSRAEAISRQLTQTKKDKHVLAIAAKAEWQQAKVALRAFQKSVCLKRERLLQEDWKAMRGSDWEDYLARVFQELGASVMRTGKAGDQGVDLIVETSNSRWAVQAKGYYHVVTNKAVQEVVAGMTHHKCTRCAVVTNSRFTSSAVALAESNFCLLIGEDELPDLVRGSIAI